MELEVIILDLPISQIVLTRIKESIENEIMDPIVLEDDLSSIGVNSITFIKIVVDLETEFDFEFDDEMLSYKSFPTINSLVEYVDSKMIPHSIIKNFCTIKYRDYNVTHFVESVNMGGFVVCKR